MWRGGRINRSTLTYVANNSSVDLLMPWYFFPQSLIPCSYASRYPHQLLHEAERRLKIATRKDHYKTLGVEKTASDRDLKKAYRDLARIHHPDKVCDKSLTVAGSVVLSYDLGCSLCPMSCWGIAASAFQVAILSCCNP